MKEGLKNFVYGIGIDTGVHNRKRFVTAFVTQQPIGCRDFDMLGCGNTTDYLLNDYELEEEETENRPVVLR